MGEFGSHKLSASRLSTGPSPAPAGGAERALSSERRGPQRCRRSSAPVPAERPPRTGLPQAHRGARPPPPPRAAAPAILRGAGRRKREGGRVTDSTTARPPGVTAVPPRSCAAGGLSRPARAVNCPWCGRCAGPGGGEQRYRWGPSREGVSVVPESASPGSASPCSLSSSPRPGAGRERPSAPGLYGAPGTVGTGVWGGGGFPRQVRGTCRWVREGWQGPLVGRYRAHRAEPPSRPTEGAASRGQRCSLCLRPASGARGVLSRGGCPRNRALRVCIPGWF